VLFGAIDVALFIIVIGGFLGVTMATGAIQAGIGRLVLRLRGRERWMIPILMGVFALGGTTYGMAEESLAFYALVITVMIAAGYDALVGAAVLLLGCGIGTLGSTLNPFATGIASGFAGVSISEGIVGRLVILLNGRLGEGQLTDAFIAGARGLLGVALIIGIARGITVVMNNGQITDTVLHWAELALDDVGKAAFSIVMYTLFLPLSFLIPSSSGLATVSMPIMAPLAGFVGVPKDLVVTAYQSASGLMNLFIPTSAVVMGGLAIARVPYGRYLRWVWPLLAMLAVLTVVVLGVGALLA
jgi:uncharacterized ion transporter superfamily protein YfcC